jgi:hypothetical protein
MIKKGLLTVFLVALSIFAVSAAYADQIDGLASGTGPAPVTDLYVNPGGLGDALIYGYYNARGSWNFIRVVNTSETTGVAAKVRFREGKNSNEVLDFAICLSAGDQWSAWVIGDENSANPASLIWYDNDTPTYPDPNGNDDATDNMLIFVPLKYAPDAAAVVTANDTKEGYFEIIGARAWADTPGVSKVVETPADCALYAAGSATVADVPNTLFGNAYIFNIADGAGTYAYNATALADFTGEPITVSLASDSSPRLDDAAEGLNAVNFVLTKAYQYATYDLESFLGGATTIINTFPTKKLSIAQLPGNGPFNDAAEIDDDGAIGDSTARCEEVKMKIWNDAEATPTTTTGFSPGETPTLKKCDEVSLIVVGSAASALVNSDLVQFKLNNSGFDMGWISENFLLDRGTCIGDWCSGGLPVIGYELQGLFGYWTQMQPLRYSTDYITD